MGEEKKEYSIIGTVTIGTDEYRDLIQDKFNAEKNETEWHNKWYKEYSEKQNLESVNNKLKERIAKLESFMKKNSGTMGDDIVSLFMSLFDEGGNGAF